MKFHFAAKLTIPALKFNNVCRVFAIMCIEFTLNWLANKIGVRLPQKSKTIMPQSKHVRIVTEGLNRHGSRVLVAGAQLDNFKKNPVLLYMHNRGEVIGYIENVSIESGAVTGDLVFDLVGELSQEVSEKWEKESLRAVSAGLRIIEWSDDPKVLLQGQTYPTITKWELREVSVVDIPADPDAIKLYDSEDNVIELSDNGNNPLPKLNPKNINFMDQKELALSLGLAEDATMEQIQAKIAELKAAEESAQKLKEEKDKVTLSAITSAVEAAINEKRLAADKKDHFIQLGVKIGIDDLNQTLAAMQPAVKVSNFVAPGSQHTEYEKLSDVPADKLVELREKEPETYKKLYKAQYGIECEL